MLLLHIWNQNILRIYDKFNPIINASFKKVGADENMGVPLISKYNAHSFEPTCKISDFNRLRNRRSPFWCINDCIEEGKN